MKDKSIQINSYKSTILMDLLEYTQHLIKSGDNSQRQQAQQLQAILQNSQVKSEQKPNNPKIPLLIGGGVVLVGLALGIGEILREELLIPRNISPQELATALKERGDITPDLATRLAIYFDSTVEFWLNIQRSYDKEITEEKLSLLKKEIKPYKENRERARLNH
ncbi:11935_t:CDS:2 [Funneliformis geosporum]|nr:11935_t:CDS:2 [Funneliformis geosporum]